MASEPSRYARLHFSTPCPSSDVANRYTELQVAHIASRILSFSRDHEAVARPARRLRCWDDAILSSSSSLELSPSSGRRSSSTTWFPFSWLWSLLPRLTKPRNRAPVLGRMKVAGRTWKELVSQEQKEQWEHLPWAAAWSIIQFILTRHAIVTSFLIYICSIYSLMAPGKSLYGARITVRNRSQTAPSFWIADVNSSGQASQKSSSRGSAWNLRSLIACFRFICAYLISPRVTLI